MLDIYDHSKIFQELSKSKDIQIPKYRFTEKLFIYEPFQETGAQQSYDSYDEFISQIWESGSNLDIQISLHPTSSLPEPQLNAMYNGNEELIDFDSKDLSSWIFQKETINFIIDKELELNNKILFFTRDSIWGQDIDEELGISHISLFQPLDIKLEQVGSTAVSKVNGRLFINNYKNEINKEFITSVKATYGNQINNGWEWCDDGHGCVEKSILFNNLPKNERINKEFNFGWIFPNVIDIRQLSAFGVKLEVSYASKDTPEIITKTETIIITPPDNIGSRKGFRNEYWDATAPPLPNPIITQTYDDPIIYPNPSPSQFDDKVKNDVYILHSYKPFKNVEGQFKYAQISLKKIIPYAFQNKESGYLRFSFFKTPIQPKDFNEVEITFEGFTLLNRLTFLKTGNVKARYKIENTDNWQFCLCNPRRTGKSVAWYPLWYSELEYHKQSYSKSTFKFEIPFDTGDRYFNTNTDGEIWIKGIINGNLRGAFKSEPYLYLSTLTIPIPIIKPVKMNFSTSFNELRKNFSFLLPKKISIFNMGLRDIRKEDDKVDTNIPQTPAGALLPRVWRDSDNTPWKQTQDALYVIDCASRYSSILTTQTFQNYISEPKKNDTSLVKKGKSESLCYYNSSRHKEDKAKLIQGDLTDYIGFNWGESNQVGNEVDDFTYNQDDMNNVDINKASKHLMLIPVDDLKNVSEYINDKFTELKTDTFTPGGTATAVLHNYINPDTFKELSFIPSILENKAKKTFKLKIKFDEMVDSLNQLEIKCIGGYKIGVEYFKNGKPIPLFPNTDIPLKFGVQEYLAPNLSGNPLRTTITKQYATATSKQANMDMDEVKKIAMNILSKHKPSKKIKLKRK